MKIIILILLLFTLIGTASAADFYVATNGNDGNAGTSSNPFKTIEHGAELLKAGDTLYIKSGTYNGEDVQLRNSGTSSNPINIIGIGDVTMKSDKHGHAFNLLNVKHINFDNIEIYKYSQGIYCVDVSYITINNCHIHFIGTSTVSLKDADHCSVTNCDLSDTGWNNVQIMSTNRDTYDIKFNYNKIHGCPGISDFDSSHNGIDLFNSDNGGNHQIRDMEIIGNEMYDMSGYNAAIFTHGYKVKHMDNFIIADNEIYETRCVVISFFRNLEFRNNNIYDNNLDGFRTLYPEKLIGPAYIHDNKVRNSNYDTRIVATGNGIVFENEDYGLLHIEGGTVTYKNPARESVTMKDSGSGKIIFQVTDGRDFTHNGDNKKTTISGGYQLIIDGETVDIKTTDYVPPNPTPTPTETPTPTPTETPTPTPPIEGQFDNKIKQSSPDVVYGSQKYLDVGKIDNIERRTFMVFDNIPEVEVESATLSVFWYYEYGGTAAEIEVFRPAQWNPIFVTWNSYDNGLLWTNSGGDYHESYDSITLVGTPTNKYYDFDVTDLVNGYIDGSFDNTGFMLKTTDEKDGYMAFYSQEHTNINQVPKLTFVNTSDDNVAPVLDPIGNKHVVVDKLLEFTVTATDENGDKLAFAIVNAPSDSTFIDEKFSWTPKISDVGDHNVIFTVSDGSLSDSESIVIKVTSQTQDHPRWDVNEDGVVDMLDLDLVALHYGETN